MLVVPINGKYEVRWERSNKKVAEFKTLKEALDYAFEMERARVAKYQNKEKK